MTVKSEPNGDYRVDMHDRSFIVQILDLGTWDTRRDDWFPDFQAQVEVPNNAAVWHIHHDLNEILNKQLDPYDLEDPHKQEKVYQILEEYFTNKENMPDESKGGNK